MEIELLILKYSCIEIFYLTRCYLIQIFLSAIHIICRSIMWCPDRFSYKESFGFDKILENKNKKYFCITYIVKIKILFFSSKF